MLNYRWNLHIPPHPRLRDCRGRGEERLRSQRLGSPGLLDMLGHHMHELPGPVVACTKPTESEAAIALTWRQGLLSLQP